LFLIGLCKFRVAGNRDVHGGGGAVAVNFLKNHRGSGRFFLEVNAKIHESERKFSVRKYKTIKLNESYRLVTTVLVLNSHNRKIHSIFLITIAVGFLFLSRRRVSFFLLPSRRGSGQFSTAMDISDNYYQLSFG
jgi:hypothetical protein